MRREILDEKITKDKTGGMFHVKHSFYNIETAKFRQSGSNTKNIVSSGNRVLRTLE